mgnify:FL=1
MASLLPVSFRSSPLPYNWSGNPNEFLSALTARLYLESDEQIALITSGSVMPTSNIGPWLKDGREWYVWDPVSGTYVPQTITALAAFDTIPFKGVSSGAQGISFATDGAGAVDLALTEVFDSGNTFNGSIFTAPVDGYYHFDVKAGLACTAGAPVTNTTLLYLKKNGFQIPSEVSFYPTEDLVGRTLILSSNLELNAGDEIKAAVSVSVAGGTFPATWSVTQNDTWFSGFKIKSK